MRAIFDAADANGDGRLDRAEFGDYLNRFFDDRVARGLPSQSNPRETPAEHLDGFYAGMNALAPDQDGLGFDEFVQWGKQFEEAFDQRLAIETRLNNIDSMTEQAVQNEQTFRDGLSEEQKAAFAADRAGWKNPATAAAKFMQMKGSFDAADADSDGRLNLAELGDFLQRMRETNVAQGVPARDPPSPEHLAGFYSCLNSLSDAEGVSLEEWCAWGMRFDEKKTALGV